MTLGLRKKAELAIVLISPVGMIILAYALFLISRAIPADYYTRVVYEQNFMHDSPALFKFYTLSCLSFLAGYGSLYLWRLRTSKSALPPKTMSRNDHPYYLYFMAFAMVLNVYSLSIILKNTPGLIGMILDGEGGKAKALVDTTGGFTGAQPLLIGLIWLGIGKHMLMFANLKSRKAKVSAALIATSILVSVSVSVVKMARYEIMPLLLGASIIFLLSAARNGRLSLPALLRNAAMILGVILAIFAGFSMLRGSKGADDIMLTVMGYGPASFNHLAAMLEGRLKFPYAGTGAYTLSFVSFIPFFHSIFDFQSLFNLPDNLVVFKSEFDATRLAGLNNDYIWVTAPGYYYSDLGSMTYPFLFGMGMIAALLWRQALGGNVFGLIMYPFVAGTVLMWFSSSQFTSPQLVTYLGLASVILGFEYLIAKRGGILQGLGGKRWKKMRVAAGPARSRASVQTGAPVRFVNTETSAQTKARVLTEGASVPPAQAKTAKPAPIKVVSREGRVLVRVRNVRPKTKR